MGNEQSAPPPPPTPRLSAAEAAEAALKAERLAQQWQDKIDIVFTHFKCSRTHPELTDCIESFNAVGWKVFLHNAVGPHSVFMVHMYTLATPSSLA